MRAERCWSKEDFGTLVLLETQKAEWIVTNL